MTADGDPQQPAGAFLFRYRPLLAARGEFQLYCKLADGAAATRTPAAIRLRWFSDSGRVLIWATRRYVLPPRDGGEWQPLPVEAPVPPRGCGFLRFEIIAEEAPIGIGFVQPLGAVAGPAMPAVPALRAEIDEPASVSPAGGVAAIAPDRPATTICLAARRLSGNGRGLLLIAADGHNLCGLQFRHWSGAGNRPLTFGMRVEGAGQCAVVPESGLAAPAAAIVGQTAAGPLPAKIHVAGGPHDKSYRRAPSTRRVSVVVTSCGRQDLLENALNSFFRRNDHRVAQLIVVEDGPADANEPLAGRFAGRDILWLATEKRVGQIAAIDYAYAFVTSPYIFHLEDDWEFTAPGFIAKSLAVLEAAPDCLQVGLRALYDTNHHPTEGADAVAGIPVARLSPGYLGQWFGFSFNPGLRRTADYDRLGRYGWHTEYHFDRPTEAEATLSQIYHRLRYHAVILADNCGHGYVRHTGFARRVPPQ